ncbi:MAG: transposase [Chloroflexi bacterium]|nr:transposase [Chloroflexota bacterium]
MFKQFTYKIYRKPKNKHLHRLVAMRLHARLYNHCIALHKRYYRLTGRHLNQYVLMRHITKLKQRAGFEWIGELGSQSVQDVIQRIERGYALFFKETKRGNKRIRPPSFKKVRKYHSFTLKQTGWTLRVVADDIIRIDGRTHKFALSRPIEGQIKTVIIKRDAVGDFWVCFACDVGDVDRDATCCVSTIAATGNTGGMDFGLKTFLTFDDGSAIQSPEFFKQGSRLIGAANRSLARKQVGSKNHSKALKRLASVHRTVARQREDWQWKAYSPRGAARAVATKYDVVWIEDLNLTGMKALWGRKVSELAFGDFVLKLDDVLKSNGKTLSKRDRFFASSKTHFACGFVNDGLTLADREWVCPQCGETVQRDINAALMIKHGRAMLTALSVSWRGDSVRQAMPATVVDPQESPSL